MHAHWENGAPKERQQCGDRGLTGLDAVIDHGWQVQLWGHPDPQVEVFVDEGHSLPAHLQGLHVMVASWRVCRSHTLGRPHHTRQGGIP